MSLMLNKLPITESILFICAFVLCILPAHPAQAHPGRTETIKELEREIEGILSEHNVPSATIALFTRDAQIWTAGIGYSDVEAGTRVDTNTIFRWGSVSKSFVAASVQIIAERGLVHLDDKISGIIPEIEFRNPWESTHPVRLAHCLEHTTGFDDLHFSDCAVDDPDIRLIDALAINPNSRRSRWKPGTYKSYSNVGPVVAAYAVETVTGREFEDFAREEIFEPLDMKTASFRYPEEADLMATGYGGDGVTPIAYDHIAYRPAGSLNASAKEIASFVQMLLNRGTTPKTRILEPQSVTRMETPMTTLAAQAGFDLGYGLGIYTTMRDRHIFHGHDGMIAGFVASYGYNTKLDCGYAVSINKASDEALKQIVEAIVGYFTVAAEKPVQQAAAGSDANITHLPGYYQSMTPMTQMMHTLLLRFMNVRKVTMKDGALYSGNFLFGKQRELIPIAQNAYHRSSSSESLTFIRDGYDTVISYDSMRGNFKKASPFWAFFRFGAFILTFAMMASSLIFAVIWVPRWLTGRIKRVKYLNARLFPLLAVLFFFLTYIPLLYGIMMIEIDKALMAKLGFLTPYSIGLSASSLCFAAFSLLGLLFSLRALFDDSRKAVHIHSLLVSIVNVTAALYLLHGHVIGIMTWSY
jgi:CubicO group peptidase (beta-lactamase class C family)